MAKYRHMLPRDIDTWNKFIQSGRMAFDEIWYDVHVGKPMDVPAGSPEYLFKIAQGVSRKRIDAIARFGYIYYIIEVKPHANMEAIGQLVTYRRLFQSEYSQYQPLRALIVCDTLDFDIMITAREQGIEIMAMTGVVQ